MWPRIPLTCIWFSVGRILITFPPCTPIGESMTVLNTADWLLGCSSPSPATGSKEYGTEVHVCESQSKDFTAIQQKHKGCLSLILASHSCWLVVSCVFLFWVLFFGSCQSCSDWFLVCCEFFLCFLNLHCFSASQFITVCEVSFSLFYFFYFYSIFTGFLPKTLWKEGNLINLQGEGNKSQTFAKDHFALIHFWMCYLHFIVFKVIHILKIASENNDEVKSFKHSGYREPFKDWN